MTTEVSRSVLKLDCRVAEWRADWTIGSAIGGLCVVLETCRQREKKHVHLTQAITSYFAIEKPASLLARV